MIIFEALSADAAWRQANEALLQDGWEVPTRGEPTKELLHACFQIQDPRQRWVYARPINPAFAIAEVLWIMAGSNSLEFLEFWNPRMRTWSDNGVTMRGAYGFRLGAGEGIPYDVRMRHDIETETHDCPGSDFDQLFAATSVLKSDPMSRQIILQIWDLDADFPTLDGPRSKDVPCNLFADLKVRDGKLYWIQYMRSNDLYWGTPYNFIQWMSIQEIMAGWLGLEVGPYHMVTSSLHVYQKHWADMATIPTEPSLLDLVTWPMPDLRVAYDDWLHIFHEVLTTAIAYTRAEAAVSLRRIMDESMDNLGDFPVYQDWVILLAAEALRRNGHKTQAQKVAEAFLEQPYALSWEKWYEHTSGN